MSEDKNENTLAKGLNTAMEITGELLKQWMQIKVDKANRPLDKNVEDKIDELLKASSNKTTLELIKLFIGEFAGSIDNDIIKLLRLKIAEIELLQKAEKDEKRKEAQKSSQDLLNKLRKTTKKRSNEASSRFMVDSDGNIQDRKKK